MSLLSTYSDTNKVVNTARTVRYSSTATLNSSGDIAYYTITRKASGNWSYVGMTKDAAVACANELVKEYTRQYKRWAAKIVDNALVIAPAYVRECTSTFSPVHATGDAWQVSCAINETDTVVSKTDPEDEVAYDELFAAENARDAESDTITITEANLRTSDGNAYVAYENKIEDFSSSHVWVQVYDYDTETWSDIPQSQLEHRTNKYVTWTNADLDTGTKVRLSYAITRGQDPDYYSNEFKLKYFDDPNFAIVSAKYMLENTSALQSIYSGALRLTTMERITFKIRCNSGFETMMLYYASEDGKWYDGYPILQNGGMNGKVYRDGYTEFMSFLDGGYGAYYPKVYGYVKNLSGSRATWNGYCNRVPESGYALNLTSVTWDSYGLKVTATFTTSGGISMSDIENTLNLFYTYSYYHNPTSGSGGYYYGSSSGSVKPTLSYADGVWTAVMFWDPSYYIPIILGVYLKVKVNNTWISSFWKDCGGSSVGTTKISVNVAQNGQVHFGGILSFGTGNRFFIDWGDEERCAGTNYIDDQYYHTYDEAGEYDIYIYGNATEVTAGIVDQKDFVYASEGSKILSVDFAKTVTTINSAFNFGTNSNETYLTSVGCDGLVSISSAAFLGLTKLNEANFDYATNIGDGAFNTTITLLGTVLRLRNKTFGVIQAFTGFGIDYFGLHEGASIMYGDLSGNVYTWDVGDPLPGDEE